MIEQEKVTFGAGVPTIWNDLLRHLDKNPVDSPCRCSWSAARPPHPH
jgi:fatty-acyl-CoA synthase